MHQQWIIFGLQKTEKDYPRLVLAHFCAIYAKLGWLNRDGRLKPT